MAKKDYKAIEKNQDAFEKHRFNYVKNALRIATYKWSYFAIAMQRQRIERGLYTCESCKGNFGPKEINRDHIEPVIPVTGWENWESYINRLFVKSDQIQILCIRCHENKTATENIMRVKNNQKPIKIKKKSLTIKKKIGKMKK
jgi:hypothetical protein